MKIKYSLNQTLINYLCFAFMLFITVGANGQISGGEIKKEKETKEKDQKGDKDDKVKDENSSFIADSLSGSVYYINAFRQHSFRTFEDQSVYDVHALANDEVPMLTGGLDFGIIMPLANTISLSAGVTIFGNGEAYNYKDSETDSTFNYTNVYMQAGIPLKLRYTIGNDLQFFAFAGITPLNILNIRRKVNYTDSTGLPTDLDVVLVKKGFTTFNLMTSFGLGVNYYRKYWGLSLSAEYRHHLLNTYSEDTFRRVHKMYGIALNLGVNYRF